MRPGRAREVAPIQTLPAVIALEKLITSGGEARWRNLQREIYRKGQLNQIPGSYLRLRKLLCGLNIFFPQVIEDVIQFQEA